MTALSSIAPLLPYPILTLITIFFSLPLLSSTSPSYHSLSVSLTLRRNTVKGALHCEMALALSHFFTSSGRLSKQTIYFKQAQTRTIKQNQDRPLIRRKAAFCPPEEIPNSQ